MLNSLDKASNSKFSICYNIEIKKLDKVIERMKKIKNSSISHIMINSILYHGSIKPENVFEAICGAFIRSPESCLFLNNKFSVFLKYKSIQKR